MDHQDESSTSRQLPERWVAKIFRELQGNYGSRFLNQWKTGQALEDGTDAGIRNAMQAWSKKLGGFADMPSVLSAVLACLPEEPPSLPEFVSLCRNQASRFAGGTARLEHKPTPEEKARADEAAKRAREATSAPQPKGDPKAWAKRIVSTGTAYPIAEQMARQAIGHPADDREAA